MSPILVLLALQLLTPPESDRLWRQALESLERSGRVAEIVPAAATERLELPRLAPGAPPLLSFRYLEGRQRYRFGELGLVMDDAGH